MNSFRIESKNVVRDYLRAKDGQLPQLFTRVFSADGRFVSTHAADATMEDSDVTGLDAVTRVFRELGRGYENIVTLVPLETMRESDGILTSHWVVAMTDRNDTDGFVGWGRYRWTFNDAGDLADELAVHFEGSVRMTARETSSRIDTLLDLPHPFCAHAALMRALSWCAPVCAWLDRDPATLPNPW